MKIVDGELIIQPTFTQRDRFVFNTIAYGLVLRADSEGRNDAEQDFLSRVMNAIEELPDEAPDAHTLQGQAETASADFPLTPREARFAIAAIEARSRERTLARYTIGHPYYALDDPQGWMGSAALPMLKRHAGRAA
jgi:hypothetical protein